MILEGILPVNKPAGFTSHDVVAKVRRILGIKRIGHTGTLDPAVTGVLPLCIGRATRIVEYIQELPKEYRAELTIGYATDTEDATGRIVEQAESVQLAAEAVEQALYSFLGPIEQIPPMYSAVKSGGRRLYELAREGKEVERLPRTVEIYAIRLLEVDLELPYPQIRFTVLCSKGTYIRTLCADIGRKLGYPAVMSGLVRTSTGSIGIDQCLTLPEIEELAQSGRLGDRLIGADQAIPHVPPLTVTDTEAVHALQGRTIVWESAVPVEGAAKIRRIYAPDGRFLGIFRWDSQSRTLRPEKVFN